MPGIFIEGDVFCADRTGFDLFEGIDINFFEDRFFSRVIRAFLRAGITPASDDLGVNVLRDFLDARIDGEESLFAVEDLFDASAEIGPEVL